MKGLKKCFGLFLVLAIMFGLSLNISSGVSAKQYDVDSFLTHGPSVTYRIDGYNYQSVVSPPLFHFVESISDLTPRATSYLYTKYDSSSGKCVYDNSYNHPGYTLYSNGLDLTFEGLFYPFFSNLSSVQFPYYEDTVCRTSFPYGSSVSDLGFSLPEYDSSTTPFDKSLNVNSMLPYNYMFNNLYFTSSREIDGVVYDSSFELSSLLNTIDRPESPNYSVYSDKISTAFFPLNFDSSLESLSANTNVLVLGSLRFESPISSSDYDLSGSRLRFQSTTTTSFPAAESYGSCNFNLSLDGLSLYYSCSVSVYSAIPNGFYFMGLEFRSSSSSTPMFNSAIPVRFGLISVTLNDDSTYMGSGGFVQSGSFPNVAPGQPDPTPGNANWFSSLTNLFNFSFLNPFAPLFSLFTNGSQCASIPIIAGMLHSNQSTYCSWFSSDTRAILTPVLGISSTMLLFGFVVRWLGSSSGNLFEDAGHIEPPGGFVADVRGRNVQRRGWRRSK